MERPPTVFNPSYETNSARNEQSVTRSSNTSTCDKSNDYFTLEKTTENDGSAGPKTSVTGSSGANTTKDVSDDTYNHLNEVTKPSDTDNMYSHYSGNTTYGKFKPSDDKIGEDTYDHTSSFQCQDGMGNEVGRLPSNGVYNNIVHQPIGSNSINVYEYAKPVD